jgi:selenide,water dikinase
MLPAVIAGQYPQPAMEIDLVRLCQSAGARLIIGDVVGMDIDKRRLLFRDRPPIEFDILSVGIGSHPSFDGVRVDPDVKLVPVKPMQTFLARFQRIVDDLDNSGLKDPRVAIVGGGVGSIEIAFCLWQRTRREKSTGQNRAAAIPQLNLITANPRPGTGLRKSTVKRIEKELQRRNIEVLTSTRVAKILCDHLVVHDGRRIASDIVIWATDAMGAPVLRELSLETTAKGFLITNDRLQTTKLENVFAVGDTGSIDGRDTHKAGVYAVRQGPVLDRNIRRLLRGERNLESYSPQRDFLKLINLGDGRAIAEYKGRSFLGRACWKLKDYIDVKFIRKYQNYEPMPMDDRPADNSQPMKCLGCGGKIAAGVLSDVLRDLQVHVHEDVVLGMSHADDAAVIRTSSNEIALTTDFFAAPIDDPFLVGRIAALNSASDCFVMGARPTTALAIVQVPEGHPRAQREIMSELMAGAVAEFNRMKASVVGGHTIEGPRTLVGFTVLGKQITKPKTKSQLSAGDLLVVSKPIGTGALLAAWMQCKMPGECYGPLIASMVTSNEIALELFERFSISAMTDVTGFGLGGHLTEMLLASRASAELFIDKVPLLPGFEQLSTAGIESTLANDNRQLVEKLAFCAPGVPGARLNCLFDPQTGGGLLFAVRPEVADDAISFLKERGFDSSSVIGRVTEQSDHPALTVRSGALN